MFLLNHLTALVTGATGGIGAATARLLHSQGARLVISGTKQEALEETAHSLGANVIPIAANLESPQAPAALVQQAEKVLGKIDILVNNAGIVDDALVLRMKDESWNRVLHLNLTVPFYTCRAVLRGMLQRRWGRIINISSVVGAMGNPGQSNYVASKAGLMGFTKSLALEVATRSITANCIAPGFIDTSMTQALGENQREKLLEAIPQKRMGLPDEVAAGVLYLASPEAGYVTGQTLHINGGLH